MNDAVDKVIVEREALDRGFSRSLVLSVGAHLLLAGVAVAAPLLAPKPPALQVAIGIVVPLPPGGGGAPGVAEPAPAPPQPPPPVTAPPAPAPEPEKPKIIKPPRPSETHKQGLPEPDAKKRRPKRTPTPEPARSGAAGGTGTAAEAGGVSFLPPGPGAPGGTDPGGDWYLASVQRKVWLLWNQQVSAGPDRSVVVRFTILEDGSITDVAVVQSSGVTLLDNAAQRAIYSAAPFGPLPKHYETTRYTIQALFKPLG